MLWHLAIFAVGIAVGEFLTVVVLAFGFAAGKPAPPMDREATRAEIDAMVDEYDRYGGSE